MPIYHRCSIAALLGLAAMVVALSPAAATRSRTWMSPEAMRTAFVGHTLDGHYGNGTTWTETYFADSRLDYRESVRVAKGRWLFRDQTFCTFYDPPYVPEFVGGCWQVLAIGSNCYEFYTAGVQLPDRREDDDGADGGTEQQRLRWNARGWRKSEPSTCPERPTV